MLFVNSFISRYSPQLSRILCLCKQGPHWSHSLLSIWSIVPKDGKCIFTKLLTCYPGPSHPHLDPIVLILFSDWSPEVVSIRLKRKKKEQFPGIIPAQFLGILLSSVRWNSSLALQAITRCSSGNSKAFKRQEQVHATIGREAMVTNCSLEAPPSICVIE